MRPENARVVDVSRGTILRIVRGSCSLFVWLRLRWLDYVCVCVYFHMKSRYVSFSIPFHSILTIMITHLITLFHFISLHLLGQSPALNGKDDAIFTLDTNCRTSTSYRLHGVLDLKQMPVGTEYCDGSVVTHVNNIICSLFVFVCLRQSIDGVGCVFIFVVFPLFTITSCSL